MERIAGLKEYVAWKQYRSALGLPDQVTEEYRMLAQGEYNRNYLFTHPVTGRKLVLRVNCGSQMHLEHQIQYEYETLKLLRQSGRTPRPFYADGSLEKIPHGIMVMEFLPGHAMDYRTELFFGAECLADIHSVRGGSGSHLVRPEDPLEAILTECEAMVGTYMDSDLGDRDIKMKIRQMLDRGWKRCREVAAYNGYECCINTELNSHQFSHQRRGKGKLPGGLGEACLWGTCPGSGPFSCANHHLLENRCDSDPGGDGGLHTSVYPEGGRQI